MFDQVNFWGTYVLVSFSGNKVVKLENRNEHYDMPDLPGLYVRLFRLHQELCGKIEIVCKETGLTTHLKFKDKVMEKSFVC